MKRSRDRARHAQPVQWAPSPRPRRSATPAIPAPAGEGGAGPKGQGQRGGVCAQAMVVPDEFPAPEEGVAAACVAGGNSGGNSGGGAAGARLLFLGGSHSWREALEICSASLRRKLWDPRTRCLPVCHPLARALAPVERSAGAEALRGSGCDVGGAGLPSAASSYRRGRLWTSRCRKWPRPRASRPGMSRSCRRGRTRAQEKASPGPTAPRILCMIRMPPLWSTSRVAACPLIPGSDWCRVTSGAAATHFCRSRADMCGAGAAGAGSGWLKGRWWLKLGARGAFTGAKCEHRWNGAAPCAHSFPATLSRVEEALAPADTEQHAHGGDLVPLVG